MDYLAPVIKALHAEGRLRVWSLVVTVFGDSVQNRGGRVATARLRALLGRIGVEDGALRTALSRLGTDGWVTSERQGRASFYSLTPEGRTQFTAATEKIYAAPAENPATNWTVHVGGSGVFEIAPGIFLEPAGRATPDGATGTITGPLTVHGPELATRLLTPEHLAARAALFADLTALRNHDFDPLSAAAARTLLIHRWRRLVLRYPEVPQNIFGDPKAPDLRSEVAKVYQHLTPATEDWLSADGDGYPAMPNPSSPAQSRFGLLPKNA